MKRTHVAVYLVLLDALWPVYPVHPGPDVLDQVLVLLAERLVTLLEGCTHINKGMCVKCTVEQQQQQHLQQQHHQHLD